MSIAAPSVPPIAMPPEGERAGDIGRERRRRRSINAPAVRAVRAQRPTPTRRASVRPGGAVATNVDATLTTNARPEAPRVRYDRARAITLVYFDPRTLRVRALALPLHGARIAAAACALLFLASATLGFAASYALSSTRPGRVLSMQHGHRVTALRSMFASVPALEGALARRTPHAAHEPANVVRERALRLGLGTNATASSLIGGFARPEWVSAAAEGATTVETLNWPVDGGWFVRGYGSGTDAYHLAVDVGAPTGNRVRAAAPGIVAYADDRIRGFGNLLLLVHPNGWITLYAHNSRFHVGVGERVAAGQLIADVGSTGISRGPHVHFELLHAGKNCDPGPLFRPGMRHRDGDLSEVRQADWDVTDGRPAEVRCGRRRIHPNSARLRRNGDAHGHDHIDVDAEVDVDGSSASAAPVGLAADTLGG
jgi:murein DD-endopeptidase MepM/ murein hydrolase activator NlpD